MLASVELTPDELIQLVEEHSKVSELGVVTTLRGARRLPSGSSTLVTIEIHDRGAAAGSLRWHVEARSEFGGFATGNAQAELPTALALVHWYELDKEPDD